MSLGVWVIHAILDNVQPWEALCNLKRSRRSAEYSEKVRYDAQFALHAVEELLRILIPI